MRTFTSIGATPYPFEQHKHVFAAWAASRAASVYGCRFSAKVGRCILEDVGCPDVLDEIPALQSVEKVDEFHRLLRNNVIQAAARHGLLFTHGIAGKLISVYVKACLLDSTNCNHPIVGAYPPPVDREMLLALVASGHGETQLWKYSLGLGWTKFTSLQYEAVVRGLRALLGEETPIWMAEQYWPGYQS